MERRDGKERGLGGNVEFRGDVDEPIKKFYSVLREKRERGKGTSRLNEIDISFSFESSHRSRISSYRVQRGR